MNLGAAQWKLKWNPPYEPVLEQVAGIGLSAIELVAWDPEDLRANFEPEAVDTFRGRAAELGIKISAFIGSPDALADPDPVARDHAVEFFADIVEVAKRLGTRLIVSTAPYPFSIPVPWVSPRASAEERSINYPVDLDWDANWNAYVEATKRCVDLCENAGMLLAIEPHPYRYVSNVASMLRLIEHVGSDALGCNVDPAHLISVTEIPQAAVYQLGTRVFGCHVSDGWGDTNFHVRPGKGQNNWRAFLSALRAVGFDGTLSLELDNIDTTHRGPGSTTDDSTPDPEFLAENRIAIKYLREAARAEGIDLAVR